MHSLLEEIQDHFGLFQELDVKPSWNIAPSLSLPVARAHDGSRELAPCIWGFVPHWMKSTPKSRPINARAETLAEKPFFRDALRHRRCLVPANGFYEWKRDGRQKQPYYFRLPGRELFSFAGLWSHWTGAEAPVDTFTIITTDANDTMRPIHDRMPVVLDPDRYDAWLDNGDRGLLAPYRGEMECYAVSRRVNSPANDDAGLIEKKGSE